MVFEEALIVRKYFSGKIGSICSVHLFIKINVEIKRMIFSPSRVFIYFLFSFSLLYMKWAVCRLNIAKQGRDYILKKARTIGERQIARF